MRAVSTPLLFAALAALSACATGPSPYAPASGPGALGYSEQRIETDRVRVSYRGGPDLNTLDVESRALQRAAELTLNHGASWFQVVNRAVDVSGSRGGGTSVSVGGSSGSYGSGLGVGVGFDLTPDRTSRMVTLEVIFGGDGPKPEGESYYDAASVLSYAR